MSKLDTLLDKLSQEPGDPRLASIDTAVLAGLARHRDELAVRSGLVLASVVAIVVGIGASSFSGTPASAQSLLGVPAAAPSRLLVE